MGGEGTDDLDIDHQMLNGYRLGAHISSIGTEYSIVSEELTDDGWWLDIELPTGDSLYVLQDVLVGVEIESSAVVSEHQMIGATDREAMAAIGGNWSEETLDAGSDRCRFFTSEDGQVVLAAINGVVTSIGLFVAES